MDNDGEKELLKIRLNTLYQLMMARTNIIIICVSLIAAILIVATFGEKFIVQTESLKFIIVFLLNLIPIALFDYLFKLNEGEAHLYGQINKKSLEELQKTPLFIQVIRRSDLFYALFISISILLVIDLILQSACYILLISLIDFCLIYIIKKYS